MTANTSDRAPGDGDPAAAFVDRFIANVVKPIPREGLAEAARFHAWLEHRLIHLRKVPLTFMEPALPREARLWIQRSHAHDDSSDLRRE